MKTNSTIKFNIIAIISIVIIILGITPITFQNDTFYTIKIGEQIAQNGIDMKEHFSWHEGIDYTYPHWLFDLIIYHIYNLFSFTGIYVFTCILGTILGVVLYFTNIKIVKNHICSFLITLLTLVFLSNFITARAQLVTFILFLLTYYCIECFLENNKKRYIIGLIIIPILIANFHLAVFPFYFILYLPYIAEYMFSNYLDECIYKRKMIEKLNKKILKLTKKNKLKAKESLERKLELVNKENKEENKQRAAKIFNKFEIVKKDGVKTLIIVMIICIFTGFITPLGATPYTYFIKTLQGTTTQYIVEHLPLILINSSDFIVVLVVFLTIMIFSNIKMRISDFCMFIGLGLLTIISRRQISMFYLICMIFLNKLIYALIKKYFQNQTSEKEVLAKLTGKFEICIILILVINLGTVGIKNNVGAKFVDEEKYPVYACDYISENLNINEIKLYNEYGCGSYILFRDIPVFIDSRADLYTPEFNDGISAFDDYIKISQVQEYYGPIFEKYGITHVLLKNDSVTNIIISSADSENYTAIYSDEYFTLYEKNNI